MNRLVEQYYDNEHEASLDSIQYKTVSVKIRIQHESLLRAICDRFGASLSVAAGEIIKDAVEDMFLDLNDKDIVEISEKADIEAGKFLAEKGYKSKFYGPSGDTENNDQHWSSAASRYLNHKKEEAKKENKKAVAKS